MKQNKAPPSKGIPRFKKVVKPGINCEFSILCIHNIILRLKVLCCRVKQHNPYWIFAPIQIDSEF